MKKTLVLVAITLATICTTTHCGSKEKEAASTTASTTPEANAYTKEPDFIKGENIVLASDCATCHKPDGRINGPSYIEIADKYNADPKQIPMLANKIIKGGKGTWGEVLMTAHPTLSQEDAEAAVKYIYYFKTKK